MKVNFFYALSLLISIDCLAAKYLKFEIKNALKTPIVFSTGIKRQNGIFSFPHEVKNGENYTSQELLDEQPTVQIYLKDNPEEKYSFEIITEGRKQALVEVVPGKTGLTLKPRKGLFGAKKDNVTESDIKSLSAPALTTKPAKMSPLIEAIVRGDSLNQIKSLFAAKKVGNINEKDEYGDTALSIAEGLDREPEIIHFLKKQGAR